MQTHLALLLHIHYNHGDDVSKFDLTKALRCTSAPVRFLGSTLHSSLGRLCIDAITCTGQLTIRQYDMHT
jgi:hypothetical protein